MSITSSRAIDSFIGKKMLNYILIAILWLMLCSQLQIEQFSQHRMADSRIHNVAVSKLSVEQQ
jgi:hypothetical protein